ncbi:MAG TPA: sigma-E processing peptidase SpoIIGA [Candidatus Faecousia faecipullorum]|nr:sigma-E processing peptidase SpoIIGA [Candidatus Faecousia faecipullorum]
MAVYLDLAVLLNFLTDFLLLLGTNHLAGYPLAPKRCALAAGVGGLYGGMCLLHGFRFLGNLMWRGVCLCFMAGIAFGFRREAIQRGGVFLLLSLALGGMAISFNTNHFPTLVLGALGIWGLCRLAFPGSLGSREYVPLTISYGNREVHLTALRDTGNTLRDPITGESVFLISGTAAEKLTGLSQSQLRHPMETLTQRPIPGLRLIPYRAVGQAGGMLLGLRFRGVKVGNEVVDAVVAFAPDGLGSTCEALVTA